MSKRRIAQVSILVLLAVAVAGGLGWQLAHRPEVVATRTPFPTSPPFTPPPSLDELAHFYPEIADLLTDVKLSSVYKEFLVAYQEGGLTAAEELARKRGLLNDQDELRLLLVLDTDDPAPLVAQLLTVGVRVENYYGDLVAVAIPLARIGEAAQSGDPGAALRPLTELEHVIEIRLPESAVPQAGPVQGEGVAIIGADVWHTTGYTGQGVKVAILDNAFDGYESLRGNELPDHVVYEAFGHESGVHGVACAEIVHDVAPDAEIYLVAYDGMIGLKQAVDWLIAQDVDIVSYSMGWLAGPRDGTSRQAQLVDKAHAAGILWVGSAGNYALSHYAAFFTDVDGNGLHEFNPGQETLFFSLDEPGKVSIALNWDDWPHSDQDLDLYLTDATGSVLASARDTQNGVQSPVEWLSYDFDAGVYYLIVEAAVVSQTVYFDLFMNEGTMAQPVPAGSLGIPADALGGLAVGATYWQNDHLEQFSSHGPTADGRSKPDLVAPDSVRGESYSRFGGTSAAAPHVAGAAALVLDAFPDASPDEVMIYLQDRALDLGSPGVDQRYGAGRLALGPPPAPSPAALPPTRTPSPPPPKTTRTPLPAPSPSGSARTFGGILLLALGVVSLVALAAVWLIARYFPRRWLLWASPPKKRVQFCGQCGQRSRSGAQFCIRCGAAVGTSPKCCPHCGRQSHSSQARFCGYCGSRC